MTDNIMKQGDIVVCLNDKLPPALHNLDQDPTMPFLIKNKEYVVGVAHPDPVFVNIIDEEGTSRAYFKERFEIKRTRQDVLMNSNNENWGLF